MIHDGRWQAEEPERATVIPVEESHWSLRALYWGLATFRPHLGWLALLTTLILAWLPALALGDNRIVEMRRIQARLDAVGPLAVLATWLLLGWRGPRVRGRWPRLGAVTDVLLFFFLGLLVLSQSMIGWLPGPIRLWQTLLSNRWLELGQEMLGDWQQLLTRLAIWWQGVMSGGAAQDNLLFALFAGLLFWHVSALMAWILRRYEGGLIAALPLLWLLGTLLLYSGVARGLMVGGVALAVILHLVLDQRHLIQRWQSRRLDYAPDLIIDRMVAIGVLGIILFLVAAVMPNLYYRPLVVRYYDLIKPLDRRIETLRDRLFPDLTGVSRSQGAAAGGLPNAFLLGGSVTLGENIVMQVRADDTAGYEFYDGPSGELLDPPGHYMRGATLSRYDGHGWDNPSPVLRRDIDANSSWQPTTTIGRKPLLQSVTLFVNSPVLYAAPEPLEPGVEYQAQLRSDGDLISIQQRARSYTVISNIPAVSEAMLTAAPAWGAANPLPADRAIHLALPDSVTARTHDLAAELVADKATMFEQAQAIEQFLRQYTYDLAVPTPPEDVVDIADYFLFDLQRGYCDYYATAFIVLARAAGIPARFATGYAVGYWNPAEAAWIITEGEAHSWPEVYFPEYGWIAFEPTAGRPSLARVGPSMPTTANAANARPLPAADETPRNSSQWSWQMLIWLIPLALLLWALLTFVERYRQRREEPWRALVGWGQRAGRPMRAGETVIEYGDGLAAHILQQQRQPQDVGRLVAREIVAMSAQVNRIRYGTDNNREETEREMRAHWQRLRAYLRQLRLRA